MGLTKDDLIQKCPAVEVRAGFMTRHAISIREAMGSGRLECNTNNHVQPVVNLERF